MTTGYHFPMHSHTDDNKKQGRIEMSHSIVETDLADKIRQLQADRLQHAQAIAQIDQVLQRVENALTTLKAMSGPKKTAAGTAGHPTDPAQRPRRQYQKFELT